MVTIPLPDAQLMTFAEFINWKPDNRRYELHHGSPIEMQPTGDREEVISFLNAVLVVEVHRLQQPFFAAQTSPGQTPQRRDCLFT